MKNEKKSSFVYRDLGLPVKLIKAPMKKIYGEWIIDLDMELLQRVVLEAIIHKNSLLSGAEIRYVRKYMYLSIEEFGKAFGVSHAAVSKWENSKNGVSPALDVFIRLYILEYLKVKDVEFRKLYRELDLSKLSKEKEHLIIINAEDPKKLKIA